MSVHGANPLQESERMTSTASGPRYSAPVPSPVHLTGIPAASTGLGGMARPAAPAASSFDILSLLRALRRRWALAILTGGILAGVVFGLAWFIVPSAKYTTTALLQVKQFLPVVIFPTHEREPEFRIFQKTQIAFLRGPAVLGAALRDPKVLELATYREQAENDQVEWLREQLRVNFSDNSEVLEIAMSGDRPADLQIIVNTVVEAYMRNVVEQERRNRVDRMEKLRKIWEGLQASLKMKRTSMKAAAGNVGSSDRDVLALNNQYMADNLNSARQRRMSLTEEIRRVEMSIRMSEAVQEEAGDPKQVANSAKPTPASVIEVLESAPAMSTFKAEESALNTRLIRIRSTTRNPMSDSSFISVRRKLNQLQAERKAYADSEIPKIEARMMRAGGVAGTDGVRLNQVKVQLKELKKYLAEHESALLKMQEESSKLTGATIDLTQEQEEIALATATAQKVGTEIESIEVELQAPDRVVVIANAYLPRKKDEIKRLRLIGSAAGGAFIVALFGVSFWEFRARRINSVEEVINNLGLNIVGALPAMPDRSRRKLSGPAAKLVEDRWQRLLVESVDAMRTLLLHAAKVESLQVVMVTSSTQGEGKTSLAGHLATSLARAGRNTLLVDCDIRRPTIHRLFDEPLDPGLCELLRGEITATDAIRQGPTAELSLVTAGRLDDLAQQILGQDRVREVFEEWKQQFEFIIIDTPPVLPVADSLFLSQHVDGVLFAILREVSRVPQVQAAYERLSRLGVRMLGAVVNGAQTDSFHGSHYYQTETAAE